MATCSLDSLSCKSWQHAWSETRLVFVQCIHAWSTKSNQTSVMIQTLLQCNRDPPGKGTLCISCYNVLCLISPLLFWYQMSLREVTDLCSFVFPQWLAQILALCMSVETWKLKVWILNSSWFFKLLQHNVTSKTVDHNVLLRV